jgi:coatomer subunit epsilon
MDPFSGEGGKVLLMRHPRHPRIILLIASTELLAISTAFFSQAYSAVIEFDTSVLSPQNRVQAQYLKYRAQIALHQGQTVLSSLASAKDPPSKAIRILAQHSLNDASAVDSAASLAEAEGEDATVQICCGTVLAASGHSSEAASLLSKHQGNLEAVMLLTQIHLSQNRSDLAMREVQSAKRWAQDSLLINLAEAWLGMRLGGEKYQSAFYIFEELASTLSVTSPTAFVGQVVSETHMGRLPEAEAGLEQALQAASEDPQAIANSIVLASIMGKKQEELGIMLERLTQLDAGHALLTDVEEKKQLFDSAAAKYGPKVVS